MTTEQTPPVDRWYHGVGRYQWLVLIVASLGWVFDAFEGQLFNITRRDLLQDILRVEPGDPRIAYYGDMFLGVFLAGGTLGGLLFGSLGDKWGRRVRTKCSDCAAESEHAGHTLNHRVARGVVDCDGVGVRVRRARVGQIQRRVCRRWRKGDRAGAQRIGERGVRRHILRDCS